MFVYKQLARFDGWVLCAWAISLLTIFPVVVLLLSWSQPAVDIWQHMADNLILELLLNTLFLCSGVLIITAVLGTGLAWLTGACSFPGQRFFSWALLLPFAVPTYVLAFVFLGIFDFTGPVQTYLRSVFGMGLRLPDMRSTPAVILIMSLSLYPYVYLLARGAFMSQGGRMVEVAQSLGDTRTSAFFRIVLPMARPWIAGGLFLVLMETLADFGAVSIFNFNTFTTAIYKAWYGFFSIEAAAQLSTILVGLVIVIVMFENHLRRKLNYSESARVAQKPVRVVLQGPARWGATLLSSLVFLMSFGIPFFQLLVWSREIWTEVQGNFVHFLVNSLLLSSMAAALICFFALLLSYSHRRHPRGIIPVVVRFATLGYALPGTVLAVALVIFINTADERVVSLLRYIGVNRDALFQGTVLTMLLAYAVRFLAAGFNPTTSSLQRITGSIDEAAKSLGVTGVKAIRKIHIPVISKGLLTAAILVFVDVMKEMPITLMTRPFGWDTLAVKIYEFTSEGEWQLASLPAVVMIAAGIIPVIFLTRQIEKT